MAAARARRAGWVPPACALALAVALFALYALTPSVNHEYDSLDYALRIETGRPLYDLFHPHHLAHGPLARLAYLGLRAAGVPGRAMELGQALSAALAALGAAVFGLAMWRATRDALAAALAALGMAFCFGWWHAGSILAVRSLSALSLALCFAALAPALEGGLARLLLLGAAHGFAVLSHQTNALLLPAIAGTLLAYLPGSALARPWRRVAQMGAYVAGLAAVAGGGYLAAGVLVWGKNTPASFARWMFAYLGVEQWNRPLASAQAQVLLGWRSLFIAPCSPEPRPLGLSVPDARLLVAGVALACLAWLLAAGWWRARRSSALLLALLAPGLALGSPALLALALAGWAWWGWRGEPGVGWPTLFAALWMAAYVPFFLWWEPWNVEYWLSVLPPLFILLGCALASACRTLPAGVWGACRIPMYGAAAGAVALLCLANLEGKVKSDATAEGNLYHGLMAETGRLGPNDMLVVLGDNSLQLWLRYHQPALRVLSVHQALLGAERGGDARAAFSALEADLRGQMACGRLYFLDELSSGRPEDHRYLEARFGLERDAVRRWAAACTVRPARLAAGEAKHLLRVTRLGD